MKTKAILAIFAASLLWGTAGLAKPFVRTFDPFTAAFLRFLVASVFILPFFLKNGGLKKDMVRNVVPLALISALNVAFFYIGIQTSIANSATLIYAGVPLVTSVLAYSFIKEDITRRKFFGIIIGMIGVIYIAVLPKIEHAGQFSGDLKGNVFFLLGVLAWSVYTVGSRHALTTKHYSPLSVTAVSIFTSCAVFFFLSLFSWKDSYIFSLTQPRLLLLILHSGLVVTVATYLLFQWAIKHSSATTASLKQFLEPIFAVTFNFAFLGERLTSGFFAGSLLVFAGIFIATSTNLLHNFNEWRLRRV